MEPVSTGMVIMVSQPGPPSCERNHLRKCSHFCLATWGLRFGIVVRISFVIRTFGNLLCLSQQLLRFLLHSDSVVKILLVEEVFQYRRAILNPYKEQNISFKVEASWKYPKNPMKDIPPKEWRLQPIQSITTQEQKKKNMKMTLVTWMTSFRCQLHRARCHAVAPWTSVTQHYSKTHRKNI